MIFFNLTLFLLTPAVICYFGNFYFIGSVVYLLFSLFLILTNYFSVKKLKTPNKDNSITWCPSISLLTIFYLGLFYFLIGYFGNYLPEYFSNADKIFHMIYNDVSKNLILSVMAAIIFSFTYDYQMFVKKYYLFLDLESKLSGLWAYILFISDRENFSAYSFLQSRTLSIEESYKLNSEIFLTKNEVENIRIGLDKVTALLSNNFIDSILNQKIHYLTINLESALNFPHKINNIEYYDFSKCILEFEPILIRLDNTKKNPFSTLILNR